VGVPVYNGERYLGRTLDALLSQTFADFELILTDNGSTDNTQSICRDYAARDRRIRYYRSDTNLGIVRNFNRCFELARGTYFKWNAADDLIAPTFLEKCVAVLDRDPSVAVAFTQTLLIDESDRPLHIRTYDVQADDQRPHVRFSRFINLNHRLHAAQEIYGLMRSSALRQTPLYEPCVRADSILLARLALLGKFRRVDEPLFLNREHQERSVALVPGGKARSRTRLSRWIGVGPIPPAEFWDPSLKGRRVFPEWRILGEYYRSLNTGNLPRSQRLLGRLALARFALRHIPKLARDLVIAAEQMLLGMPDEPSPTRGKAAPMHPTPGRPGA
jgi:glycosyltransferase involved in cell wall biosynthesis